MTLRAFADQLIAKQRSNVNIVKGCRNAVGYMLRLNISQPQFSYPWGRQRVSVSVFGNYNG